MRPILTLFLAAPLAAHLYAQPKPRYEVYAIRYATIPEFAVNQLVAAPARRANWISP
jgi:hypothetical protein